MKTMQYSRGVLVLGLAAALFISPALTSPAAAGPVEELIQFAEHPSNPAVMALRYEFGGEGLVLSTDGGQSWHLVCNSAIEPGLRGGPIALASDGTLLLGVFDGIWTDDTTGCGWSKVAKPADLWVRDFAQHPTDPDVLFTVTSSGGEVQNGIYRRDANGAFTAVGVQEAMLISALKVADTGAGLRFYQSGLRGQLMVGDVEVPNYLIRVSNDDGATFTEYPYSVTDTSTMTLEAVDPTNADRIVVSIVRDRMPDSVMVSSDGGANFTEYMQVTDFGGIAFAPDGRVWIADGGDTTDPEAPEGLWFAQSLDETPTSLTDQYPVNCLAYRADSDSLFVCQRFGAGTYDMETDTFSEVFNFTKVESFASCSDQDMLEACEQQLLNAYCGITHFPLTPVCEPYGVELPDQGKNDCAFDYDAGIGTGTNDAGGCLMSTDAGTTTTVDAGMQPSTGGTSAAGAGGPRVADPCADGACEESEDDGGCSVGAPGSTAARAWVPGLFGLLALGWQRRRRRRGM